MGEKGHRYEAALTAAEGLMGTRRSAELWLKRHVRALNAKPIDLLSSDAGLETVLEIIGRLEHGVVT